MHDPPDLRWFKDKSDRVYETVFTNVDNIRYQKVSYRQDMIMDACGLYGDVSAFVGMHGIYTYSLGPDMLTHNILAPAMDTLVSEITQTTIRPMAITKGGSYADRQRAGKLTQYFDGKWDQLGVSQIINRCVLDSLVMGMGIARVYRSVETEPSIDSAALERIFPGNLIMDDRFCVDTMPREFNVSRLIDRYYLADLFPSKREEIMRVEGRESVFNYNPGQTGDYVEVIEAVRLASAPRRKDGRRTLCIRNATLSDKEFTRVDSPYKFLRGLPSTMGWWGEFLIMRGAPAQLELNKQCYRMQEGHHLFSVPRVFVNRQSGIVDKHINNDIGVVIEHDGEPPTFHQGNAFSGEFYNNLDRLEQWVYKAIGVSELSAVSQKPAGLDSGAALRSFHDFQTRRWANYVKNFEKFCEDIAWELAITEKEIAEDNPSHSVSLYYKKRYEEVKWKDIELDSERFAVRIFSANALPNTPAGRLQALEEMVKTGVIDQTTFIKLADVPDLESVRKLLVAGDEIMESTFDKMLEEDKFYATPEPGLDLKKGRILASQMAWKAQLEGADEKNIEKLYTWIDESYAVEEFVLEQELKKQQIIQQQQMLQQQAAMMQQGGMPQQGPMPPQEQVPMM